MDPDCPVCATAEVVCGKWTLLLVRDLAEGKSRFCELERSLQGISPRTLSLRLRALEDEGIVERLTHAEVPPRVEYALTPRAARCCRSSTACASTAAAGWARAATAPRCPPRPSRSWPSRPDRNPGRPAGFRARGGTVACKPCAHGWAPLAFPRCATRG